MMNTRLIALALVATGCAATETFESDMSELAVGFNVDPSAGSMILGSSTDRRWIAYGTGCEASNDATRIKLYDTLTSWTTELASGVPCQPGAVMFSPDGSLVAFGDGQGHLEVHDSVWHRTVPVSRQGLSTIGIVFSPDSSWFVVASADPAQPLGATLDAWDADLLAGVPIASHALFSPFGPASSNLELSPDSQRLLYLGNLAATAPVGTLTIWDHGDHTSRVLATGVPAGSYAIRADWQQVAYLWNAATTSPASSQLTGTLVIRNLVTNQTRTLETAKIARPLGFAGNTLLYGRFASSNNGAPLDLKSHRIGTSSTVTVDSDVFAGFGPNAISISPDGSRFAYTRHLDQMTFSAELRVASASASAQPKTIATDVIPFNAYGWIDAGRTLAFLHGPTSTFPGAAMGSLSAWDATHDHVVEVGTEVTQIGLAFDPAASELLFVSSYDMARATGDLRAWSATTRSTRLLGHDAAVVSVQRSPDRRTAGYLQLQGTPAADTAPRTRLRVSRIIGTPRTVPVADDVTSFAIGWSGRVLYTTSSGVFDAVAY